MLCSPLLIPQIWWHPDWWRTDDVRWKPSISGHCISMCNKDPDHMVAQWENLDWGSKLHWSTVGAGFLVSMATQSCLQTKATFTPFLILVTEATLRTPAALTSHTNSQLNLRIQFLTQEIWHALGLDWTTNPYSRSLQPLQQIHMTLLQFKWQDNGWVVGGLMFQLHIIPDTF